VRANRRNIDENSVYSLYLNGAWYHTALLLMCPY
jgi:hypothetical protein